MVKVLKTFLRASRERFDGVFLATSGNVNLGCALLRLASLLRPFTAVYVSQGALITNSAFACAQRELSAPYARSAATLRTMSAQNALLMDYTVGAEAAQCISTDPRSSTLHRAVRVAHAAKFNASRELLAADAGNEASRSYHYKRCRSLDKMVPSESGLFFSFAVHSGTFTFDTFRAQLRADRSAPATPRSALKKIQEANRTRIRLASLAAGYDFGHV